MIRKLFLLSPDGVDGGPPAANIVLTGTKTERELALEEENARLKTEREELAAAKKKAEMDAGQLQDELHRVTTPPARKKSEPKPEPEKRSLRIFRPRED